MAAEKFAELLIKKLNDEVGQDSSSYTEATPNLSNIVIAEAITEYLKENVVISVSYIGTIPGTPPTPDPIVADTTIKITGECGIIVGTTFNDWVKDIELKISSGFFIGKGEFISPVILSNLAFTSGLVISQEKLKTAQEGNMSDPQLKVWTEIAQSIINWLTKLNPISYSASTSVSTGTATVTNIIIN